MRPFVKRPRSVIEWAGVIITAPFILCIVIVLLPLIAIYSGLECWLGEVPDDF